jgi:serine/threonine-protein kinase
MTTPTNVAPVRAAGASAPLLEPGTQLAHYEVRAVLGSGGMGTVYLAHDTALDRPVALKVLKPEIAGDPALVERFVREARAAARVSHPNLTHVYFVGTEEGRPFFAMEHCPGTTLEAAVKETGPFPLARGIDALVQAARGLAAAHGGGVIHRDVKPSNLMALPDGTVKVADFGLAKSLEGDVALTAGKFVGTPAFMSPEQVRGKSVDARTDVYLLGLTAYFLFTGKAPYDSPQVGEVIHDQMSTPLPRLTLLREDLPPALEKALARMCAKDPEGRPASMAEVVAMLEALRPRPLTPAPLVGRIFATAIDLSIAAVVWGGLGGLLFFLLLTVAPSWLTTRQDGDHNAISLPGVLVGACGLAAISLCHFLFEIEFAATLGKKLLHLRVVRSDGTPPARRALLLRFLWKYPGILAFFVPEGQDRILWVVAALQVLTWVVGTLWCFFADGRTLWDLLTRTRVVHRGGVSPNPVT